MTRKEMGRKDKWIVNNLLISKSRYITTITLKEILKELDNKLTEEDLNGIIDEVDADGSGTIDFDGTISGNHIWIFYQNVSEFVQMMTG